MEFTPQQLNGGPSYSKGVKVGNWKEDVEDNNSSLFEGDKKEGTAANRAVSALSQHRHKMKICNSPSTLTGPPPVKVIRYGDVLMLESIGSKGALACDPFEEIEMGSKEYLVSAAPHLPQIIRTAFRFLPVKRKNLLDWRVDPPEGGTLGEPIKFGQSFHISCHTALLEPPPNDGDGKLQPELLLSSSTTIGHRQVVYLKAGETVDTVWKFRAAVNSLTDAITAVNNLELPVPLGVPIVIEHRQTGNPLFCDGLTGQHTDFGKEYAVSCHHQVSVGKNEQLLSEANGSRTARTANKVDVESVKWVIRW